MKDQKKIGVVLSYAAQAVSIVSGLVYTPIMLRILGQSEYGLYQLVYSVVSYLGLLNFNLQSAYIKFFSRTKEKDDEIEMARLNGMFLAVFSAIAVICLICGAVMVLNIEFIFSSGLSPNEYEKARVLFVLMIINLAITFPTSVFGSIASAHEQFFVLRLLALLQNVLNPFLTLPLLLAGFGSVSMVVVSLFINLLKISVDIWYCIKKLNAKFLFTNLQFGLLKEIWIFSFFIFMYQIIDQINWNVPKFILGRLDGTVAVAIFSLGANLNSMFMSFSNVISNVFVPKVNRIVASSNDNNELLTILTKVGRIQFLMISIMFSGFVIFGYDFMLMWGGPGYGASYYVALLLMGSGMVPLIQNLAMEIQRAKNMHKTCAIVNLVVAIINVLITIPLVMKFGSIGAASGTAITMVCGNVLFMNWYYKYRMGLNITKFWLSLLSMTPAMVIPVISGLTLVYFIDTSRIISLFACIAVYGLIYLVCMYFMAMNETERALVDTAVIKFKKILKRVN